MARSLVTLTQAWQQLGTAQQLSITVKKGVGKRIYVNETGDDTTADIVLCEDNHQFVQNEDKDFFARCEEDGDIDVVVDTAG
jgi:hypothetical protein